MTARRPRKLKRSDGRWCRGRSPCTFLWSTKMMMDGTGMMGMMVFMFLFGLLLIVLFVVIVVAIVKWLRDSNVHCR